MSKESDIKYINEIKVDMADTIIQMIREENLDITNVAIKLGMTVEEVINIILRPNDAFGSELLLIDNAVRKRTIEKSKIVK